MNTVNARIKSTMLGVEDHGILTAYIHLDYGGSGQGFGGYALDSYEGERGKGGRQGTAWGMEFIRRVLETVGAERWEQLPGMHCRVRQTDDKVQAIGHIIENKWFDPNEDLMFFLEPK